MVWYSHLFENFPLFVVIHTVIGFSVVSEADVFYDPMNAGNLISGSSAFSKSSLYIWKFSVHILLKPLTVWITTNCGEFLRKWEYQITFPASWETCMQMKQQKLEPDMEQLTGSKLGKEYVKAVYCNSAYLTCVQSISYEILG